VRIRIDDGTELNAEFNVEAEGPHLNVVLESAGGRTSSRRPRNGDYVPALTALLQRLRAYRAVLLAASVVSNRVSHLPESERALLQEPVDLVDVSDIDEFRLNITRAQGRVALPEKAAKDGNNRKRIQLRLHVPGYGPGDAARLGADLAAPPGMAPQAPASEPGVSDRQDLLDEVGGMVLHRQDGRPSLHKPLALLWTIGRLAEGKARLVSWPEFHREVGTLLADFGPEGSRATPQYPFWHLATSERLWEVHGLTGVPTAADVTAVAGLTRGAAGLLRDRATRDAVVEVLFDRYLSGSTDRAALLARVGLRGDRPANLPGAIDVIRPLIGVELHTVTSKRPNIVLELRKDIVLVGTDRSPTGQPVRIQEIQRGLDLLARHRTVRVSVEELGHRSSFVGAVLATLPDAEVLENPAAVTLRKPTRKPPADDVHFGELDGVTQVRVRREQAQLRRLLAGERDRAECALCGDEYPLAFLVAAHVKKRSVCTDTERRDLHHVAMLACAFGCDALYESGWITVDDHGVVQTIDTGIASQGWFRDRLQGLAGRRCSAHSQSSEPYFAWHRATVFRGGSALP
jgi:hypothetical protein